MTVLSQPLLTRAGTSAADADDTLTFHLNGEPCTARRGDTVLTAILLQGDRLRLSPFSGAARAGFCLMGACQDCWVLCADGTRVRACSTLVKAGMALLCPIQASPEAAGAAMPMAPPDLTRLAVPAARDAAGAAVSAGPDAARTALRVRAADVDPGSQP